MSKKEGNVNMILKNFLIGIVLISVVFFAGCSDNNNSYSEEYMHEISDYSECLINLRNISSEISDEKLSEIVAKVSEKDSRNEIHIYYLDIPDIEALGAFWSKEVYRFDLSDANRSAAPDDDTTYLVYKVSIRESDKNGNYFRIITLLIKTDDEYKTVYPYQIYVYDHLANYLYQGEGILDALKWDSNYYELGGYNSK